MSCVCVATEQAGNRSPVPSTVTVVSPTTTAFGLDLTEDVPKDVPSQSYPGAVSDFYGLPSNPICIYRTGAEWPVYRGLEAQRVSREARPVFDHPLRDRWPILHIEVYKFLDSVGVMWSTIDPVRFAEEGKQEFSPVYLWIGVTPKSLSYEDARVAAIGCKQILADADLLDIEIAFRESLFIRSSGPQLLEDGCSDNPISDIQLPFTPSLGIHIAPKDTPHFEGTGALYFRESSQSERVFLLTARHVALPPSAHCNELYSRKNSGRRRVDIIILGSKAYTDALEGMTGKIGREVIFVGTYQRELAHLGDPIEGEMAMRTQLREGCQAKLANARRMISVMDDFHSYITKHWSTPSQRVLGYVLYAPPISLATGLEQFTEDWAFINLDLCKIDWNTFKGNVMYLGDKLSSADFVLKMHPHPKGQSDFKWPLGGFLQIKGIVNEAELRSPTQLDANGEQCLLVIKNGRATGVTIGRISGIESVICEVGEYNLNKTSLEVAVYPYSKKDGAFSTPGDSGSIVVDGKGRLVGLLTAGSGATDSTDVTYITPYFWLEQRIKEVFPSCFLYPIVDS